MPPPPPHTHTHFMAAHSALTRQKWGVVSVCAECLSIFPQQQGMADRGHDGVERDAEDTDELLYTDVNNSSNGSGLDSPPPKLDPCDLLLDAIDAQLGQLQIQPQTCQTISRGHGCNDTAPLSWSQSLSKDTGFGSTTQTNDAPMCCLDLIHTPKMDQTSERSTGFRDGPVAHEETKQKIDRRIKDKEESVSHREQVIWRLKRLLGDTCNEGRMAEETHPPSDSICTEDFVRCFRDEMVELALPASNMPQLDKEGLTERTAISDCDNRQSEQKGHSVLNVRTLRTAGTATTGKSSKDTETAHYCQRKKLEKCLDDTYGVNKSWSEKTGAEERYNTPQRLGDDGSRVPVRSFDTVSIDSDSDSVCTEPVRQHIHRQPGWRSLIQSVMVMDDSCTNHSDYDTHTQGSEAGFTSGQRSSNENVQNRSSSKAQRNKRETYRLVCSLGDNDKDTDEEINHWSRRCRPERTSEKMQSDWAKMKERLSTIRQKCEKEEMTLQRKKTQINDVELSLSELQQRRKHALQELKRLTVETSKMEKEKRTLEFVLRNSRAGQDSISCQLNELQRQRESCILEPSVVMSVLERKEMDRQLDNAKTELFAEQRRAREKLESIQERLEETREAESLLRNTCASLEEKQKHKQEQIEAVEFQVGKLQGELGECRIRVGTQEKMLAQKELQVLDLQEQREALQAERDGLRGELQHMEIQHCNALKEAHEQAHRMMEAALKQQKKELALAHEQQIRKVNKQTEEEKANALKEQALFFTRHIEALKSSVQLKEDEAKQLRGSLEQQQNREEELHLKALEKERESSIQRQQLRMDRDQALDSLKERLIKEHIEELSSLNWPRMCEGGAEGGGVAASLRKQLKAKELELRQVQRSMGQWKEQTAARLACKFEEELTAELERCKTKLLRGRKPSKPQEERQRDPEKPDGEMTLSANEAQKSVCSPFLRAVDSAASHSPSDVASFKLLRYLQSRVKQLRVENQAHSCSPSPSNTIPLDLSGSYLTTTQSQDVAGIQSHSSIRTVIS
ncbi:GRIP and coiled-coil domain-containing protein 2 isoform X8 [Anarrhichthys ocellatus]|uniref:GRIP and coiled-coil domain-containing protein 2 isoform X8 n=1 Tax=Anarrhichthys ocellatus TaxID=433405 RepID=UPI0012EE34EE|nr:GRIP and coiled-coil domain-containing protein 2-like isoform X8 [Anarrhichthys ocellatus]